MFSTARLHTMVTPGRLRKALVTLTATAVAALVAMPGGAALAASRQPKATGSVVAIVDGPFGPMLVAGSGPAQYTALYTITADYGHHIGCTTKVVTLNGGSKLSCTGSLKSSTAEWPAYLTSAAPVAGPGVNQKMLGEVKITGLGEQVTYNGHPLYLFDSIPGLPTGENWDEPTLPPWHGNWYLVSPAGSFLARTAILSTVTIKGKAVLAALMEDAGGFAYFPVYSFSGGTGCTGTCAGVWPPLISRGNPGTSGGVSARKIGRHKLSDGTTQLTYGGKALYFDSNEKIVVGPPNGVAAAGNGNGAKAPAGFTGTFSFVTP